jgi:hypothetical protein
MRSEQFAEIGATPYLAEHDQTHVLTLVAGVSVRWGIDLGLRFRLASGRPYTPIVGSQFVDSASGGRYWDILGEENSARMPLFHQLDLRLDKRWQWRYLALTGYLDIQNIYNKHNVVYYIYNDDYTRRKAVYDLPILPSIGLKLAY